MKKLKLSTVNKAIQGLGVELVQGTGYFYFVCKHGPISGSEEMVYRLNHCSLSDWVSSAESAKNLAEKEFSLSCPK